jgi:hypothetical protein
MPTPKLICLLSWKSRIICCMDKTLGILMKLHMIATLRKWLLQ